MIRAAHLIAHGRPPELVETTAPTRSTGEAVVAVTAAPITPLDVLCATGTSYFGAPALPYVPGVQGVGTIVEASHLAPDTRVWFPSSAGMTAGDGSLAERALATEAELVPLPDGVTDELVAGLGLSAIAAWMSLTWRARLQSGETVLVLGAGGVVGQVAVQAARILGARRVVAAARSADSRERARSYAADDVVELRAGEDVAGLAARFEQACGGPVSVVIDPLCGVPGSAAAEVLAEGGRLVNLGSSAGATAQYTSATLRSRSAAILGYTNNSLTNDQRREALTSLLHHAAEGRLTVDHETVEWDDLPDAWARQADGLARRRIVVRVT
ncbi:zinc-binding dehydrogenase [Intrasporangium sp.]|jgi:NADPH:quinone reductase-like Zn-dependent oxidoreductase|uniref:quinone oxidoreductase family protein n=1 Tax=Intrasporangium sp. TaxID=1925024 RepID=UPI00336557AE